MSTQYVMRISSAELFERSLPYDQIRLTNGDVYYRRPFRKQSPECWIRQDGYCFLTCEEVAGVGIVSVYRPSNKLRSA